MVGFAFVSSQGHVQTRLDRALWLHGNVGFGVSLQASGRANPRIKIEDVCTLHRGVNTFLNTRMGSKYSYACAPEHRKIRVHTLFYG